MEYILFTITVQKNGGGGGIRTRDPDPESRITNLNRSCFLPQSIINEAGIILDEVACLLEECCVMESCDKKDLNDEAVLVKNERLRRSLDVKSTEQVNTLSGHLKYT